MGIFNFMKIFASKNKESIGAHKKPTKHLWWVRDLELKYNGSKYALKYTSPIDKSTKTTQYVYDDVEILNEWQARVAQKQADGTYRYGVASTGGYKFIISNCDYTKVSFWDGCMAVWAVDENDNYAISRQGSISRLYEYTKKATNRKKAQKAEDETE